MDFPILLVSDRQPGIERKLDIAVATTEDWPAHIYVSRFKSEAMCMSPVLEDWDSDTISRSFLIYDRTEGTNESGRRIYKRDQHK